MISAGEEAEVSPPEDCTGGWNLWSDPPVWFCVDCQAEKPSGCIFFKLAARQLTLCRRRR